jgi:hypothetical protein
VQKEKSHTKVKKQENTKGKVVLKKSRTKTIIKKKRTKFRSACILSCPFAKLYHCLLELGPGRV